MRHIYIMSEKSHFRSQALSNISTYQNEKALLVFDGAETYACAYFSRELAAGVWALFIDCAQTCLWMQKITIAVWSLSQHEKLGSITV